MRDILQEIATVEYAENEAVAFLTVLAHEGLGEFHGRGLYRLVAVQLEHPANGGEDVFPAQHLGGREVAGAFGDGGFQLNAAEFVSREFRACVPSLSLVL